MREAADAERIAQLARELGRVVPPGSRMYLKEELDINIELASPLDFLPPLPAGTISVAAAKTNTGIRTVDLPGGLRSELATLAETGPQSGIAFPNRNGAECSCLP